MLVFVFGTADAGAAETPVVGARDGRPDRPVNESSGLLRVYARNRDGPGPCMCLSTWNDGEIR